MKMPRPIDLRPAIARAFVKDMRAYFAETDQIEQNKIALRQFHAPREFQEPREKKLTGCEENV